MTASVSEIYEAYQEIKANTRRRGSTTVLEQVTERFGISKRQWTGMKIIYERAQAGDEFAQGLLDHIDSGALTVSLAWAALDKHCSELAKTKDLPSRVQLRDLYATAIRTNAYAEITATALRHGVKVNPGGMSEEERADCIKQARAASLHLKAIADTLSRSDLGKV